MRLFRGIPIILENRRFATPSVFEPKVPEGGQPTVAIPLIEPVSSPQIPSSLSDVWKIEIVEDFGNDFRRLEGQNVSEMV